MPAPAGTRWTRRASDVAAALVAALMLLSVPLALPLVAGEVFARLH